MINRERLVDNFLTLAAINSPTGREKAVADALAPQLRALGFEVVLDGAGPKAGADTGNLIATRKGNSPQAPPIMLTAHMDTVSPTDGWGYEIKDGIIRSKGNTILGADDKAGIAAILEAVTVVVENRLSHGDLQVVMSVSEETGLFGAKYMNRNLISSKYAFVYDTDKPTGCVTVSAPSHDNLRIRIRGKAAHAGAYPEQGISAIVIASKAICAMSLGRIDFETTANIGIIQGGTAKNAIPEICDIDGEARSRDNDKLDAQVQHMLECVHEAAAEMGGEVDIELEHSYRGYRLTEADEVVRIAVEAARKVGIEPELHETGGGSDASVYNLSGIPATVIGVGYEKPHSNEECVAIEDLVKSTEMAVAIIQTAAGG